MEGDDGIRLLLSKNDDRYQLEMPLEKVTTVSLWNGVFKKVKSSWFSRGTLQEVHIFNLCRWQCESKKWIKEADSRKCPGKQCARSSPYLESVIRIKTQLYCLPLRFIFMRVRWLVRLCLCCCFKQFLLQRCYCLSAKRYPHVNLIYLEGRIDPSTWLTIMLWRELRMETRFWGC